MEKSKTWNPELYLRYAAYRARPADDLLPRLNLTVAGDIYDLGCGPGTLTRRIKDRWPERNVTGIDASAEMLGAARTKYAEQDFTWTQADISQWSAPPNAALIFANASLHWVPDHATLIPRLFSLLAPGGLLAFQVPLSFREPFAHCIDELIAAPEWREKLAGVRPHDDPLDGRVYYDLLCNQASLLDIWHTDYFHVLEGEAPVADWISSTGLVPFLSVLPEGDHAAFIADYAARTNAAYRRQKDGTVLFVMPRLFVVAKRK
jgi:trans-aconitate 2-methyltransferase